MSRLDFARINMYHGAQLSDNRVLDAANKQHHLRLRACIRGLICEETSCLEFPTFDVPVVMMLRIHHLAPVWYP